MVSAPKIPSKSRASRVAAALSATCWSRVMSGGTEAGVWAVMACSYWWVAEMEDGSGFVRRGASAVTRAARSM